MNKVMKVCIALAAIAAFVVLPASASASNSATVKQSGTPLAAGDKIIATGNHDTYNRLTGPNTETLIRCTTNELTGTLTSNTHTLIAGNIESATFKGKENVTPHTTHCNGSTGDTLVTPSPVAATGLPWCLQILPQETTDHFSVRGGACSEAARTITFSFHATTIFGTVTCSMERNEPITGTYTTGSDPVFTIDHVVFTRHAGVCPVNTGSLDLRFTLWRDTAPSAHDTIELTGSGT